MSLAMVAVNQTIHFHVCLTCHCNGNFSKLSLIADYCVSFPNLVAVCVLLLYTFTLNLVEPVRLLFILECIVCN